MIWVILVLVILIFAWVFLKGAHKVDTKDKSFITYLFVYRITEECPKGVNTEFLVNWKLTNLENHRYLLYLTLEEDQDIEEYLHKVLANYSGHWNIYGRVYRTEGIIDIRNILMGTWKIIDGRLIYHNGRGV